MGGRANTREHRLRMVDQRLRKGTPLTAAGLAEELGLSERTIRRDLEILRDQYGAVLEYDAAERTWRYPPNAPPLRFKELPGTFTSSSDRFALLLSLSAIEEFRGTSIYGRLKAMHQRLLDTLPAEDRTSFGKAAGKIRFLGPPVPDIDAKVWDAIINCLMEPETLRMTYVTGTTGKTSQRDIDPYTLIARHRDWMLVGYDHSAKMVKTFLIRRIRKLELTDRPFEQPADFDADAYFATSFDGDQSTGPVHHVKLRFLPEAAQYGREFVSNATQKITEQPDGSLVIEFDTAALYRVEREVLAWGGKAEVAQPDALARSVECAGQAIVYGRGK